LTASLPEEQHERLQEGPVKVFACVMVLALCASACAGGAKEKEFDTSDAQAIRQVSTDLETAFNAKDIDKILSLYTENSVFMPPNKPLLRGREPLKGFYDAMLSGGSHDLKLTVDDVAGHGPIAYESGSYSMMNGANRDRGKFLFILRNMAGNWKIEYTSWSSDLPPPALP
jgi:ketosteroid isomerase-like protein